ncbi:hypothetical protein J2S22_001236 [Rhodoplanes tepidamans]|nr:hypothetical protein [Rhodoplanes tepidamans]
MKLSHLATFLVIIMGGAVQNAADAMRRNFSRERSRPG